MKHFNVTKSEGLNAIINISCSNNNAVCLFFGKNISECKKVLNEIKEILIAKNKQITLTNSYSVQLSNGSKILVKSANAYSSARGFCLSAVLLDANDYYNNEDMVAEIIPALYSHGDLYTYER